MAFRVIRHRRRHRAAAGHAPVCVRLANPCASPRPRGHRSPTPRCRRAQRGGARSRRGRGESPSAEMAGRRSAARRAKRRAVDAGTSREARVASPAMDAFASSTSLGRAASAETHDKSPRPMSSGASRGAVLRARGDPRDGLAGTARRLAVRLPGAPRFGAESASDASMTSASRVVELATLLEDTASV